MLRRHGIGRVVDVRAHPGSRRMPHFGRDELRRALPAAGIEYVHEPRLGGRRRPVPGSPNGGWEKSAFQAYADHMASADFDAAVEAVIDGARRQRTALMCAEALWWRCHRRLVADALTVRGWRVWHLARTKPPILHELTRFSVVEGTRVSYPPSQPSLEA